MAQTIQVFIEDPAPLNKFINDFNIKYSPGTPIAINPIAEDIYDDIINQIDALQINLHAQLNYLRQLRKSLFHKYLKKH